MSILLPECIPPKYQEKAEEVRAYLVQLRGGAPFLSGADGRLLIEWLDKEVPIPAILSALDVVCERRRAKRVRSRLSLNVCKGALRKVMVASKKKKAKPKVENPICDLADQIDQLNLPKDLLEAKKKLLDKLLFIGIKKELSEERISHVMKACREFHTTAWQLAEGEHEQLQIESEEELEALKAIIPYAKWQEAVEEVMRDKVRMRYSLISAQKIWDAINQTEID